MRHVIASLVVTALIVAGSLTATITSTPVPTNGINTPSGVGDTLMIDDWSISVTEVTDSRSRRGRIVATVEVTNTGSAPGYVSGSFKFGMMDKTGAGIPPDDECSIGATYEDDAFFTDVFPGATAIAELCWSQDRPTLALTGPILMYVHAFNRGSDEQAYYYFDLTKPGETGTPAGSPVATPVT